MKPEGALYCNGQYVDHGGHLQECIDAIQAALPTVTIDVSASSSGSVMCNGSSCHAEGEAEASASCAFSPKSAAGANAYGALTALAALGAACFRRRRAR